ncbi:lasso RiPP family leader peptide-containing protein [Streptomyces sp. NRRL S-118]|nr:lasso RiPP family leader peptide-containing protein [Streptomyces sp. NRRL S-118]
MRESGDIEQAEVYEPPVLEEVGGFTEKTEGYSGFSWDGWGGFLHLGG